MRVCVCVSERERVKERGKRVLEVGALNKLCVGYKMKIRGYDLIFIYCNTHYTLSIQVISAAISSEAPGAARTSRTGGAAHVIGSLG